MFNELIAWLPALGVACGGFLFFILAFGVKHAIKSNGSFWENLGEYFTQM